MGSEGARAFPQCRKAEWVAEMLEMQKQEVYNAVSDGKIPQTCIVRIGRRLRFKERETLEWIASGGRTSEAAPKDERDKVVSPVLLSPFPWAIPIFPNGLPMVPIEIGARGQGS